MKASAILALLLLFQGPSATVFEPAGRVVASGRDPMLAVRASGAIGMLKAEKGDVYYQISNDGGDTFGPTVRVNTVPGEISAHGENTPQLYSRGRSELYALWQAEGPDDSSALKLSRSPDWGESWLKPVAVDETAPGASQGFYTMNVSPNGTVYAAWLDGRDKTNPPGTSSLYIARSVNRGASFEKSVRVAGSICPCCRPYLTFTDDNIIHIGWRGVQGDNIRDIMVSTSMDGGKSWAAGNRVAADNWQINGCPHAGPALAVLGKRLFVSWYTVRGETTGVYMTYTDDGGKTFARGQLVSEGTVDPNHPYMLRGDGRIHLVFQARDKNQNQGWGKLATYYREILPDARMTPMLRLGQLQGSASYPTLALEAPGRVYVAWTESTDKGSQIVFSRGRQSASRSSNGH